MKARERLFGGRGLCENLKETLRKSTEEKRLFRQKTLDTGLVSAPISVWIASGTEWLSYQKKKKKRKRGASVCRTGSMHSHPSCLLGVHHLWRVFMISSSPTQGGGSMTVLQCKHFRDMKKSLRNDSLHKPHHQEERHTAKPKLEEQANQNSDMRFTFLSYVTRYVHYRK